ncbi:M1 family peptidase [Euzebyella marina]|uniref:Aminopeptidase N n=1 Tax=Euzebyella marina TaxID=1761453 RepID=A0A3G2L7K8_9FLAO|nr:M1 family metallopeptidase [Euzebyella marina]AYN68181.1 M1 family peptidase [Euzebyella marina]
MIRFFLVFFFLCGRFYGQHQQHVNFVESKVVIEPLPKEKAIKGTVSYTFKILSAVDSVFLDAQNIHLNEVSIDGEKTAFENNGKRLVLKKRFKKNKTYQLKIAYTTKPKQTVYFLGWDDNIRHNEQIWTQGQGKYTSHWLPSFDDMQEKVEFDVSILAEKNYEVIANGQLRSQKDSLNKTLWQYDMQKPMSSYLLAFAIGNYNKQKFISKSGVSIDNYYYPSDSLKVEPTYRYTQEIFDFLESEIGVTYPWQNYKQVPVRDFIYAGMENTGCTIFSEGYVVDSTGFVDKNYVNVNAHELAHQWFGNLVTEKDGHHHWLHEGFATYYAYMAEKKVFGNDFFYWKLWDTAQELHRMSEAGRGEALTDPKSSSLTFYEKGAWALAILRERVGEDAFQNGMKSYLTKYSFQNATIEDFLNEIKAETNTDLTEFEQSWLNSDKFPEEEAITYLKKYNESIRAFVDNEMNGNQLKNVLSGNHPHQYKIALLEKFKSTLSSEALINSAIESDLLTRQKMLQLVEDIPMESKEDIETLLGDKSYISQELALYKLWSSFSNDREKYLEVTEGVEGLPNKNVRLLWLTLAIVTESFKPESTNEYYNELVDYTDPSFSWDVRMGAFQYLAEIGLSDDALVNLIDATEHHSWQFKKYARNLTDELLQQKEYQKRIATVFKKLNQNDFRYINSKLKEE